MTDPIENWFKLYEECPLDLEEIREDALDIEDNLDKVKRGRYKMNDVNRAKFLLSKITGDMTNRVHFTDFIVTEKDEVKFNAMAQDIGRMFKMLEDWEIETIMKGGWEYQILSYINRIEEMLYNIIYTPLRVATDLEPNDKPRFLKVLKSKIEVAVTIFGSQTRDRKAGGKTHTTNYPIHSSVDEPKEEKKPADDAISKLKEMEDKDEEDKT